MRTPVTLAVFTLGLAAVFGAALGVGTVVGPVGYATPPAGEESSGSGRTDPGHGTTHEEADP